MSTTTVHVEVDVLDVIPNGDDLLLVAVQPDGTEVEIHLHYVDGEDTIPARLRSMLCAATRTAAVPA